MTNFKIWCESRDDENQKEINMETLDQDIDKILLEFLKEKENDTI